MADEYYRYCSRCEGKVVMHAFSDGECAICEDNISTSHTPCDKVCRKCSLEKEICMSCNRSLKKPYEITLKDIEEAVEYVFRERPKSNPDERKFKLSTYCRGVNGPKTFTSDIGWDLCSHPECGACRGMEDAFKEEVENWANTTLDNSNIEFPDPLSLEDLTFMYNKDNPHQFTKLETLTASELIDKYEDLLSEETIKQLKTWRKTQH